jgi:hypothetical protein
MTKIYLPCHKNRGIFDSIEEIDSADCLRDYTIEEMVRYNKVFRDYLREHGVKQLFAYLCSLYPAIKEVPNICERLKEFKKQQSIAKYDLLCLPIASELTLAGVHFHGLVDIKEHVTHSYLWSDRWYDQDLPKRVRTNTDSYSGLNVIEVWMPYPCFDFEDSVSEDRCYHSYFLTRQEVTREFFLRLRQLDYTMQLNFASENVPVELLPIVHFPDDCEYMIVAAEFKDGVGRNQL